MEESLQWLLPLGWLNSKKAQQTEEIAHHFNVRPQLVLYVANRTGGPPDHIRNSLLVADLGCSKLM
jgi:hypothetical protein